MAAQDVWSFISYAHDDNLPTGGGQDEEGFVSFLQRMLEIKLKDLGSQEAKLWRDAKRFSNGDPYDVEIEDALKKSALLIVVLSRNWLKRPYCQWATHGPILPSRLWRRRRTAKRGTVQRPAWKWVQ